MDARELKLDCDEPQPKQWRVFCQNTGLVLSSCQPSPEYAWSHAADRLARCLSDIRRSACNVDY